jgi:hypothetical protein
VSSTATRCAEGVTGPYGEGRGGKERALADGVGRGQGWHERGNRGPACDVDGPDALPLLLLYRHGPDRT